MFGLPLRLGAGARPALHTRAGGASARERAPRRVGLALLETVFDKEPPGDRKAAPGKPDGPGVHGDIEIVVYAAVAPRRSYTELPVRWLGELVQQSRVRGLVVASAVHPVIDALNEVVNWRR